jgi:hypothetical protein
MAVKPIPMIKRELIKWLMAPKENKWFNNKLVTIERSPSKTPSANKVRNPGLT